jgi:hypothetical protein
MPKTFKKDFIHQRYLYVRYRDRTVTYVGQTTSLENGRPFRKFVSERKMDRFNQVVLIKVPRNVDMDKWEAYLVCKLRPEWVFQFKQDHIKGYLNKCKHLLKPGLVEELELFHWDANKKLFEQEYIEYTYDNVREIRRIPYLAPKVR